MSVVIRSIVRETRFSSASLVFQSDASSVSGWHATVEADDLVLHVSQMEGENRWIVDGKVRRANGFPLFMNGFGARFCVLEVASAEVAEACQSAIAEADAA